MAVKYLSGNRLWGTNAERLALAGSATTAPKTSWKLLDRQEVSGGATSTITVSGFTAKENLMILFHGIATGGTLGCNITFNGDDDTDSYYARKSTDGGGLGGEQQDNFPANGQTLANDVWSVFNLRNEATREKLIVADLVDGNTVGDATDVPHRRTATGKWSNTSVPITTVTVTNSGGDGDFADGSEVVVLGCDDDEADTGTDNFWQELGNDSIDALGTTISTSFTAKKYIIIEAFYSYASGGNDPLLTFNDEDSDYAYRRSINGGTDALSPDTTSVLNNAGGSDKPTFDHVIFVNRLASEKLYIAHSTYGDTAVDDSPERREYVGKWADTSEQVTSAEYTMGSGNLNAGARMRVWGGN